VTLNGKSGGGSWPKVLFAADAEKTLNDPHRVLESGMRVCHGKFEAIEAAAEQDFDVVVVGMDGSFANLKLALKSLRKLKSVKRVILLARMFQEPLARQLVNSAFEDRQLANDYLICPISSAMLLESICRNGVRKPSRPVGTQIRRHIEKLEELATTDELTGLKNRRYIREFFRQALEHARRQDKQVTLMVFDIDNFKHYNDDYGHAAGDEILKEAAVLMQRCCRNSDAVGRIGGDEFAVVFWDEPDALPDSGPERRSASADHPREAIFIAKRFRTELNNAQLPLLGPEGKGVLTISGGLATFPQDGGTYKELFAQADNALLKAKRSGKNRIYIVGKPQNDIDTVE